MKGDGAAAGDSARVRRARARAAHQRHDGDRYGRLNALHGQATAAVT
jgi:hypothetical protein